MGMRTYFKYPQKYLATAQARAIEDFIIDATDNREKPTECLFSKEATVIDEFLVMLCLCMIVYYVSLTPYTESLEIKYGSPSTISLDQYTLVGSTHASFIRNLKYLTKIREDSGKSALKFTSQVSVPLIGPSADDEKDFKRKVEEANDFQTKAKDYAKNQQKKGDSPKAIEERKKSSLQSAYDQSITFVLPTIVASFALGQVTGYMKFF